ncbi:MAG: Na+/H+ antiporter NhaC family protein [Bacteroidales bacterium]|nr:Na+/H+ antiporter NhaC family protein [Bacteroidales bacterium]
MNHKTDTPSLLLSIVPVVALIAMLVLNVRLFGDSALDGSVQIVLLLASALVCGITLFSKRKTWLDLEKGIINSVSGSTSAIVLLLLIGALAGSWMLSGVIPAMMYYGLKFINPTLFLATSCVAAAIVSVSSGSSWTTIATIGVGLLGVGKALGFETGWIAGAIISGAYFGDKVSPLSETTNMASSSAGSELFSHIRYLMITTIPSFIITLIIYLVYGFFGNHGAVEHTDELSTALATSYNLSPLLFIVPLITVILIAKKVPAIIVVFVSVITGAMAAIIFQPDLCLNVSGGEDNLVSKISGVVRALYGKVEPSTGNETLNALVTTKGMSGMLNTIWLIICAMTFGGVMDASGMLKSITQKMVSLMKSRFSTVAATAFSCLFLNGAAADQYIAILLPGRMFSDIYKKKGYRPELLSRTLEDSATVTSVLIPWNTCGMAQSTVLGVATITYMPFCFFNLISPIMTLIVAAIGYKIDKNIIDDNDFNVAPDYN